LKTLRRIAITNDNTRPPPDCRVLPPGEFNGVIPESLSVYRLLWKFSCKPGFTNINKQVTYTDQRNEYQRLAVCRRGNNAVVSQCARADANQSAAACWLGIISHR